MKAIETVYNGYRFRSRLEARWAVFFDSLHIPYEYEREGYDLDGVWYLPDFWLPQQGCWIEIKGEEPTEEERTKVCLLALHDNKRAYIFSGMIDRLETAETIPENGDNEYIPTWEKHAYCYDPSELVISGHDTASPCSKVARCEHGDDCPHFLEFPPNEWAKVLYRTEVLYNYGDFSRLRISPRENLCYRTKDAELVYLIPSGKEEQGRPAGRISAPLPRMLKEYEQAFIELLSCRSDSWEWGIAGLYRMVGWGGHVWGECPACHIVGIISLIECQNTTRCLKEDGYLQTDTPRLRKAYTAARQARFEYREKSH